MQYSVRKTLKLKACFSPDRIFQVQQNISLFMSFQQELNKKGQEKFHLVENRLYNQAIF